MLTEAQELKLGLLADGVLVEKRAREALRAATASNGLTSADYASTSGPILRLEDDVWVNAPIADHNPNFVSETPFHLVSDDEGLFVEGAGLASRAWFWPQPSYHGQAGSVGPYNHLVVTHGDRARLSPLRGCSMVCKFCNIPYDDPISVYRTKPIDACLEALEAAVRDPLQPAHHILISGGTPKPKDIEFEREVYRQVLTRFPDVGIDIMMAPVKGVLDLKELRHLGVHELSINVEIYDDVLARQFMRNKFNQGRENYLEFIRQASEVLGPQRVRSILLVGLEPIESTLQGVEAISAAGGVPVLSPFRPDPATPLRDTPPPAAAMLREVFLRSAAITERYGTYLGPSCPPCTHNTLGFAMRNDAITYEHPLPIMV